MLRVSLIILTVLFAVWLPHPPQATGAGTDQEPAGGAPATAGGVLDIDPGRYGSIQHVRTPLPRRTIALTFDDGPDATRSGQVLDILDARDIKATFFYVGVYARMHPERVVATARRGHNVACHSWSHPTHLRSWSQSAQQSEVRRCFGALEAALAGEPPEVRARLEPMFRFPGLNEGPWLAGWLNSRGILVMSAEGGTDDWRGISSAEIHRRTLNVMEASDGGMLILHETRPNMIAALPGLLDELVARGFGFVQVTAGSEGRERALASEDAVLLSR